MTGELASSYTQEFVAAVLGQRIELILAGQVFDERGLELTDDDISAWPRRPATSSTASRGTCAAP